jgi:phage terminase large subunit
MYITCNPGGVGHGWVKRLFIDRDFREGEKGSDYKFIPAMVYDNKALLSKDPDYIERLKSLPASLRDAWLYGKWDAFAGQFFPEFDLSLHTTEKYEIPKDWQKYCAIDYGLDMLAAVFVALNPDGEAIVYDEVYEKNLIVSEAAKRIREKADGVCQFIAPSDLWSRQKDSGKSIYELFCENGVYLSKISPERVQSFLCLKEWLKPYKDSSGNRKSRMVIFRNCTNLIRCLPQLLHDPKKPGDASTKPHEITHAPDALRYFASSRAFFAAKNEKKERQKRLSEKIKGYTPLRKL